jgi:hypothetical protein
MVKIITALIMALLAPFLAFQTMFFPLVLLNRRFGPEECI